jgi:hypothetical protein
MVINHKLNQVNSFCSMAIRMFGSQILILIAFHLENIADFIN